MSIAKIIVDYIRRAKLHKKLVHFLTRFLAYSYDKIIPLNK
jgi:hypothetical protein